MTVEIASLIVRGVAALAAVGSLWAILKGLGQMRRSTEERSKREDARHAEAMRALEALIKGQDQQGESSRALIKGLDQQGESLRALIKGQDQQGETMRAAVKGLETVIERTAPGR